MPRLNLETLLKSDPRLPARPEIVAKVLDMTRRSDTGMATVARSIAQDPAIAARVLRMANSSLYGFPYRVATIDHAVVLLGMSNVRDLVIAGSLLQKFDGVHGLDLPGFWRHCLAVGIVARILTRGRGVQQSETIFLHGLLHDTGKLLMATLAPEEYAQARAAMANGAPTLGAEERFVGVDHTEVGAALFNHWGLPKSYAEVALAHHDVERADTDHRFATSAVHVADALARAALLGDDSWIGRVPHIQPQALELLGTPLDMFPMIVTEAAEAIHEASASLGLTPARATPEAA